MRGGVGAGGLLGSGGRAGDAAEEPPCPAERVSPCRLPGIGASFKRQQQAAGWGEAERSDPAEPPRRVCKPGEVGRCDCCMKLWPALGAGGHGHRWVSGTPVAHGGIAARRTRSVWRLPKPWDAVGCRGWVGGCQRPAGGAACGFERQTLIMSVWRSSAL